MLYAAFLLASSAFIAWMVIPKLRKQRMTREILVFSLLLLFAAAVSAAQAVRIQLPNPMDLFTVIYKPISDAIYQLLT